MQYLLSIICVGSAYAIIAMGLNLQWGYTGLFNLAVHGMAAVGGYGAVIMTTSPSAGRIGGFAMPYPVGLIVAALIAGLLGAIIGRVTLHLEFGFFAIATLGLGMMVQAVLINEGWIGDGVWGIGDIPRPFDWYFDHPFFIYVAYAVVSFLLMVLVYIVLERLVHSPWGRIQMAIKEDELLTQMLGKDIFSYRMQSLVLGAMIIGLGGAVYAHYQAYINPESYDDIMMTFIPLLMVVAGGSGNNKGSIIGAFFIWTAWSTSEIFAGYFPLGAEQLPHVRMLTVGVIIIAILRFRPRGLIGRERAVSAAAGKVEERVE
ncbi:branched-chain amino acid ABC transporter permease [Halarsenatibacter silvermanii]|uniref:Amino acid/amide ABC transporter membrane protein 2, HAAT family n=1 Tax=Halarsenatibacter silvermanii TaxID=321763 RepID=A0A1G9I5B9_9FIRM|nr:branched-chain amino acid ABC transporter permease [Halarsenatibacter silvermanii]SDL20421.1 amino acid/amide ABC transporter membrane protein 2, HAAT family [Halarsenatibacter silvermanii]